MADRGGAVIEDAPVMLWESGERIEGEALIFLHGAKTERRQGLFPRQRPAPRPLGVLAYGQRTEVLRARAAGQPDRLALARGGCNSRRCE